MRRWAMRAGAAESDAAPLPPITTPEMFMRVHRLPSGTKVLQSFVLVSVNANLLGVVTVLGSFYRVFLFLLLV